MRLTGKAFKNAVKGFLGSGGMVWPLPQPSSRPSAFVWLQPVSGLFFPWQGGRGDLPKHHRAQRHSPGSQGTEGVPEVPQAAAGGGAGDGNAAEHNLWSRNHRAGLRELGEG